MAAHTTAYRVFVVSTGGGTIDSGTITVVFPDPGDCYSFAGFGGQTWNYAAQSSDGQVALRYEAALDAGDESEVLLLFLASDDRSQTPSPAAYLMITAPGFDVTVLPVEVPY